jgi:UDP-N-acetylglucosamine 4-epimerase
LPELDVTSPQYRDFRAADVRHSLASIEKASQLLGYKPTHTIRQGMAEAMDWYVQDLMSPLKP